MSYDATVMLENLLELAAASEEPAQFWEQAFRGLCARLDVTGAVLAVFERGRWRSEASCGPQAALPVDLLSDALDEGRTLRRDEWVATPLLQRPGTAAVLALRATPRPSAGVAQRVEQLAAWLAAGWRVVSGRARRQHRIERLETILGLSVPWGPSLEMDTLLEKIAEASTRLLGAERASVFLWDRDSKTLVGRPALGVEGGELRIPDDTGIVGQVIHTGEPRRVDRDAGQQDIDRRVDQQLGFQTRTLLCVPLRGRAGTLFGAFELINKRVGNFTDDDQTALIELAAHAAVLLENTREYEQLLKSRNQMADQAAAGVQLIGTCPAMDALRSTIARVAGTELAVLILGEHGTGKEVVARSIHYGSRRRREPFIAVNCAALPETLLESELFGHEKGAFTDARERRIGKFELASGGTLFLDEIGDMSLGGQAKLLRVLEEKLVVRVGGSTSVATNARVLAATNQQLAELVRQHRFREDLYFRLNVVVLELPPLRQRGDDVLLLADQFLADFARQARRKPPRLTAAARKRLLSHPWPGNVRELRNLMERIVYLTQDDKVDANDLAFTLSPRGTDPAWMAGQLNLGEATREFQIQYIQQHIQQAQGNMTSAAERLGLHRANLYRKMRQLEMDVGE
ncbi:MAG: sigma-54-dependent Fis family transcriptional regulator [Pirellulaceae bacterium]|jgi:Nif-specific regulatory protein|nr:sigma-54-dependent Fis family transcriptional regulator [Pirellulaceae bacterium]